MRLLRTELGVLEMMSFEFCFVKICFLKAFVLFYMDVMLFILLKSYIV
jgi:hypothetical protein